MNFRSASAIALVSIMLAGMASAVTVTSDEPTGTYAVGDSFTVKTTFTFDCTEEGTSGADYTATIVNSDDFDFLNVSTTTVSYDPASCRPGAGGISYSESDVEIDVNVTGVAPAFESFDLQPGLAEKTTNTGGNFSIQQEYIDEFTVPETLGFESVAGGVTATIGLSTPTNADSVFFFEVTDFDFDGEEAPEGAMAHIQESLEVDSPLSSGETTTATSVDLHFSDHGGHEAGDDHDDAMETEDVHIHWATANITVAVTMAPEVDLNSTSEVQNVVITITNADPETMPHDDAPAGNETDDEGFFQSLPGYETVVAIATIGAIAVLARRREL